MNYMIIISLLLNTSLASPQIFQSHNTEQLEAAEIELQESIYLKSLCRVHKSKKLILWPCFLSEPQNWSDEDAAAHCENSFYKAHYLKALPETKYMKRLNKRCQISIRLQQRILDYKAKES